MGEIIIEDIALDITKFYHFTVEVYQTGGGGGGCDQDFVDYHTCCQNLNDYIFWLDFGADCNDSFELCIFSGLSTQRLIAIKGPYDTQQECDDDNP